MIFWTFDRVAAAIGDSASHRHPRGAAGLAGISTDSRNIGQGELFVALDGGQFDGHDYVGKAVEAGAAAVVVSRRLDDHGVPVFVVPDTLVALGQLANYYRRAWGGPVVMVAGSNGKTTTKDLISAALSRAMRVHATTGNLNNRIGVPLTLLAIPPAAEIAVVEAGTNIPGEVAILRDIMDPDITVVTSIGEEHLEGLGDLAGVLREEASAFEGVRIAITPASQPEIAAAAHGKAREVITAGLDDGDLRPDSWTLSPEGIGTLTFGDVLVTPPLRGAHNLRNTMLALGVAHACGVSDEVAAAGIHAMPVPRMRVAWEQVGSVTLVNDAYNSNPGSARAAVDIIRNLDSDRQRVIVLGTMRELGGESDRCHDEIASYALDSGADIVAGVGDFAGALGRVAAGDERTVSSPDVGGLWAVLEPRLKPDAVILLKASRGVRLEQLVPQITTWAIT